MDAPRRREAAHAPQLHIDNTASAHCDRRLGMFFGMDALVEADRRHELPLQLRMAPDIVPAERLLDHHQVVGFQFAQASRIRQRVCGIRVHHQANFGKRRRNLATGCTS